MPTCLHAYIPTGCPEINGPKCAPQVIFGHSFRLKTGHEDVNIGSSVWCGASHRNHCKCAQNSWKGLLFRSNLWATQFGPLQKHDFQQNTCEPKCSKVCNSCQKSQAQWPGRNARPNVFCTMSLAHAPNMRPGRVLVNIVIQFHLFSASVACGLRICVRSGRSFRPVLEA